MHGGDWFLVAMIAAPGVFGLAALVGSIILFRSARPDANDRIARLVAGSILLTVALGVAACYGTMFIGSSH